MKRLPTIVAPSDARGGEFDAVTSASAGIAAAALVENPASFFATDRLVSAAT